MGDAGNGAAGIDSRASIWKARYDWIVDFCKSAEWANWFYDDETFYNSLAEHLQEFLGSDITSIQLYDVTDVHLVGYAFKNPEHSKHLGQYGNLHITAGRYMHLLRTHEPIIMDFEKPDSRDIRTDVWEQIGMKTGITLPLVYRGSVYGVVNFLSKERYRWEQGDHECLLAMASIIAPFIVSRDVSVKFTEAQVLDERRMLSSELHDNLSQMVNTVRLEAEQAMESLRSKDFDSLEHELEILDKASTLAMAALRDEMLSLRDSGENASSLVAEISNMVERFEKMWNIKTQLNVGENVERVILSERMLLQVSRVIHEALANVIRHANAENVSVDLALEDAVLSMRVTDDGCGFDPSSVPASHMGLRIMRERIESVGGELAIVSEPGDGTAVLAALPVGLGRR